jgi:DNA-binding response OmpR family regulator
VQNVVQLRHRDKPTFRERIADVERLLAIDDPKPLIIKVSRTERILMELLLKRNMLTREVAWGILYGHRPDADQPQYRVISSTIHHLRNRLSRHGVKITTEFGTGWYLTDEDRKKLEQLLACKP